ncbi:peroxidase [Candidatus Poribacteria bacterium]|nr:MAG: peroxidase [Candidatus Poribacteria bacterium]
MQSHSEDLREQVNEDQLVRQIKTDFHSANLDATTKAILEFAEKVTVAAYTVQPSDLDLLRSHGLDDETIFDVVEIVGFFNSVNRIADALGIELEDFLDTADLPSTPAARD